MSALAAAAKRLNENHGLQPWLRSYAAPRLYSDALRAHLLTSHSPVIPASTSHLKRNALNDSENER
jgi:hypothetical protein